MAARKKETETRLIVKAPAFQRATFTIRGTVPYVQNKFSAKARALMRKAQEAGSTGKTTKEREPKDFEACYQAAMHKDASGRHGIPANAFRAAMIDACRTVGIVMTRAKLAVFVEAEGVDPDDGTPLIRITKGKPHYHEAAVRNESGVADVRPRPMWDAGWEAKLTIRFDSEMIDLQSVGNLLVRVGQQVGIGEGRPNSKKSVGMGWGLFDVTKGA